MPYIGRDLNRGNYLKLDDISSSFNSSTTTFNLTVGGSAFTPGSAFSILVSVGGVIQEPESAYQVENSEITFANAPTAQDSFFCLALGVPIGIGVPGNGTVNGTQMAKPFNYDGFFFLDDANNRVGINSSTPTVALDVDGIIKASSFTGGSGGINAGVVTCTGLDLNGNGDVSGNFVIGGDLTVNGTTSTIDTNLIGVDRVEVGANSNTIAGIAVTQSGTADLVRLYDGSTQVVTVTDTGDVGIGYNAPDASYGTNLNVHSTGGNTGARIKLSDGTSGTGNVDGFDLLGINGRAYVINRENYEMYFSTNNLVRMRINGGGQVNIGNNITQTSKLFYVDGTAEFTSNITCRNQVYINGTAPQVVFTDTNQDSDYTIKNDGGQLNFIDRTNSDTTRLYVSSGGFGGDRLYIADDIVHQGDTDTRIRFNNANVISFETAGADRFALGTNEVVVNDPGNDIDFRVEGDTNANLLKVDATHDRIGVGVASPQQVFHVYHASDNGLALFESGDSRCRIDLKDNSGQASVEAIGNQLRFGTSSSNNERLRIASDGVVSIGTQNKSWHSAYKVFQVGAAALSGQVEGDGTTTQFTNNAYFDQTNVRWEYSGSASDEATRLAMADGKFIFSTAAAGTADNALTWVETLRIDSDGRLSLGVGASPGSYPVGATARQVQAEIKGAIDTSNNKHDGSLAINCTNNNANLHLIRSDNNQNADVGLSNISFSGYDGSDYHVGAQISAVRDAAGGNNDIPARLVFLTTADGASTPTERLRITSTGQLKVGNNPTINSGDFVQIEAPTSFNSGETIVTIAGNSSTTGPRLNLKNLNTGANACSEILGSDAGGQSTGYIRFNHTDQTNNYGEISFGTRDAQGSPPAERMRIANDGRVNVGNYVSYNTSVSGIFAPTATTSGKFSYKAIEIGTQLSSGNDQGALIVGRRKSTSSSPATLVGCWDDGTDVTLYYGGGWGSHAGSATRLNFYTDTYNTGNNSAGTRLSIGSKGQIFLNNRDSNNSSHRGNIIAYAPTTGEFAYKSLEIGSTLSSSAATGGLIVAQRKGTTPLPFALMGSWDDGSNCTMYYGGGWGSQSANATMHRFYTGSYQSSSGSSGTEVFTIDGSGNLKQQRISSGGSGFSYFTGSSEYVFGSTTSSPSSGGAEAKFQIHDAKTRATLSINGYMNNAGAPFMQFVSSRSGTVGTLGTKASSGDFHGDIRFMGDNGTNYQTLVQSASIMAKQVSTISDGDTVCGGEIQFYTGNTSAGSVTEKLRLQSDGKLKYGLDTMGLPGSIQGGGFMMYADNGSNNITRLTFTGLISGCYIATIGYYNAAGQGMGGAMFFVSGYQTATHTYDIHEVRRWDGAGNSDISGVTKNASNWYIEITNTHSSYNGGGEVNLYGDGQATFAVTYRQ